MNEFLTAWNHQPPAGFEVTGPRWYLAEDEIRRAAARGAVGRLTDLCDTYLERVRAHLAYWEKKGKEAIND